MAVEQAVDNGVSVTSWPESDRKRHAEPTIGFQTSSGKKLSISTTSLHSARLKYAQMEMETTNFTVPKNTPSFSTAAGAQCVVSLAALKKAHLSFVQCDGDFGSSVMDNAAKSKPVVANRQLCSPVTPPLDSLKLSRRLGLARRQSSSGSTPKTVAFRSPVITSCKLKMSPRKLDSAFNVGRPFEGASNARCSVEKVSSSSKEQSCKVPMRVFFSGLGRHCYGSSDLIRLGVHPALFKVIAKTAATFHFPPDLLKSPTNGPFELVRDVELQVPKDTTLSADTIERTFLDLPGVEKSLLPNGWVRNHYKWIVWKLASLEMCFPTVCARQCLTVGTVLDQLSQRYSREIETASRPVLRKILNRDLPASVPMVLCVSEVVDSTNQFVTVELTDGWYGVLAMLDERLSQFVRKDLIRVGMKLFIIGAVLHGATEGCEPLEVPSDVRLKLRVNSVRRARWHCKLGRKNPRLKPAFPLHSFYPNGGRLFVVNIFVHRIYPPLFFERLPNGVGLFRNEAFRRRNLHNFQDLLIKHMEKSISSIMASFAGEVDSENKTGLNEGDSSSYCQELPASLKTSIDPCCIDECMGFSQRQALVKYQHRLNDSQWLRLRQAADNKAMELMKTQRIPTPVLKLRISGYPKASSDIVDRDGGILNIWRPYADDVGSVLREGRVYRFYHLEMGDQKHAGKVFNSCADTKVQELDGAKVDGQYRPRCLTRFKQLHCANFTAPFNEVDIVGFVINVVTSAEGDKVYLADEEKDIVAVMVPDGIRAFTWESVLHVGNVVGCQNLIFKKIATARVPQLRATMLTSVMVNPRVGYLSTAVEALVKHIRNKSKFLGEARDSLTSLFR